MAVKRDIRISHLAADQIDRLYHALLQQGDTGEATVLMNDFLDVVFGDIAYFPERFPVCGGIKEPGDYRMALLVDDFRIIFQIKTEDVLILMIIHQDEWRSS